MRHRAQIQVTLRKRKVRLVTGCECRWRDQELRVTYLINMLLLTPKTDLNRTRPTWEKQLTQDLNRKGRVFEVRNRRHPVRVNMTWSSFILQWFKRSCTLSIKRTVFPYRNLNIRTL